MIWKRLAGAACAVLLMSAAAIAQPLPAVFDVTGVAADDVLNVRAAPRAGAEKIGALAHDATGIEVVQISDNGKWGQVNVDGVSGWAALRFMRRDDAAGADLPKGLVCFGTEPFWDLSFSRDGTANGQWFMFDLPGEEGAVYQAYWSDRAINRGDDAFAFELLQELTGTGVGASGIIRREYCNDGMSEQRFGLSVNMILQRDARMFVNGCCSISAE